VNQHSEASDKKLSQPSTHHETATATKAAELFNTNRRSAKLPIHPRRPVANLRWLLLLLMPVLSVIGKD
jgi:hypothetical protein